MYNSVNFVLAKEKVLSLGFSSRFSAIKVVRLLYRQNNSSRQDLQLFITLKYRNMILCMLADFSKVADFHVRSRTLLAFEVAGPRTSNRAGSRCKTLGRTFN